MAQLKISANVSGGTDTTASVTTKTPNSLAVTNSTEGNITVYNVDAKNWFYFYYNHWCGYL